VTAAPSILKLSDTGPTFREAVIKYKDPDSKGMNMLNSPRVDDVYNALLATPASSASSRRS
jgi:hypothetical protein